MSGVSTATYITAAAAAASMAGNYIQTQNNNASMQAQTNAKNAALQEGLVQQHQNQAQATDVLNNTLSKFTQPSQQQGLGDVIAQRTNAIQGNMTPAAAPDTNIKAAPQVVQSDLAKKMSDAAAYGKQQAGALGAMGATNDQFLNNNLNMNDSGLKLNTISNFAQGDLGVNKLKQQVDANNARKSPSSFGNILSSLGTAGSIYGMGAGLSNLMAPGPTTGLGDAIWGTAKNSPTGTFAGSALTGGNIPVNQIPM